MAFATKPALAVQMIRRALAADVPFSWVAADAVYGVGDVEQALRRACKGYGLGLLPEEKQAIGQVRTAHVDAYHYELRGRQLALALTKSNLVLARRMFSKATELDPDYARALAGLVICDCYLHNWHGQDIAMDAILAMADKAVDLDPSLPEAHTAQGFALFCNERYDEADRSYRQALALDPSSYSANFFFASTMMRFRNERERMVSLFKMAARLRPDDYISPLVITAFLPWSDPHRPEWARTCIERADRAARLNPEDAAPLHRGAVAFAYLGDSENARSWLARALAIEPDEFVAHVNASSILCIGFEVWSLREGDRQDRDHPLRIDRGMARFPSRF